MTDAKAVKITRNSMWRLWLRFPDEGKCRGTLTFPSSTPNMSASVHALPTRRHISAITKQELASMEKSKDQDRGKGAMEQDQQNQGGNTSMQGQLGHRDEDEELKNADADLSW
jgi:hypothetical protein